VAQFWHASISDSLTQLAVVESYADVVRFDDENMVVGNNTTTTMAQLQ
jgi:hypothetical protein